MARPPSTVSSDPAVAAITARTATVMETRLMKGSRAWAACSACSVCSCASSAGSCSILSSVSLVVLALFEQAQVDGIGHGLIARIIGMQLVAQVEAGVEGGGIGLVRHRRGKIHHPVKGPTRLDPGIIAFAHRLP